MAETILCSNGSVCNCICNCQAYLENNRQITFDSLVIDENEYTFNYTITNQDPSVSYVVFCVQCPSSKIIISGANTIITVTGNPNDTPIVFSQCFSSGCESQMLNSFYVEYEIIDELCCRYQGLKIDINSADTITELAISITFTLPENLKFTFTSGNLKIKTGQVISIVNNICMPGCVDCCINNNICKMWLVEKNILESNKKAFIYFARQLLPPELDLSTITIQQLENIIRSIVKVEKSSSNLICNVAKALEKLNNLENKDCFLCQNSR